MQNRTYPFSQIFVLDPSATKSYNNCYEYIVYKDGEDRMFRIYYNELTKTASTAPLGVLLGLQVCRRYTTTASQACLNYPTAARLSARIVSSAI
ncbi:hypothetical protein CANCADRAFT_56074 [Tortispora caseinolytica NRRL Y-17796]|uniref:Uncharacterized protein n=1 Tax=Tortispora caseinolytica NRRL Y-17796 TaxID=767744 RepID=A0A1E4TKX3_9ASCO|nr:hypothetical protein CANCADRAFT_56074 [Tortispora caseinolytica NRRL Y-17796]